MQDSNFEIKVNYINNIAKDTYGNLDEDEYINDTDKYDIYDENEIPLNNYKERKYKSSAIKQPKGKGKFIKKVDSGECLNTDDCKCGKCQMNQIYAEKFDIMHSQSLFIYSNILKEYKKESKIFNYKNFFKFFIDEKKFNVKLIYKASENKYLIKNLLKNIKNNESKKTIGKLIIIKFSNDLYFAFLNISIAGVLYGFSCFFTIEEIKYGIFRKYFNCYDDGINVMANVADTTGRLNIINNENSQRDNDFYFQNSFSEAKFNKDIKLKHKYIKKNTTCSVIDLEYFNINYLDN